MLGFQQRLHTILQIQPITAGTQCLALREMQLFLQLDLGKRRQRGDHANKGTRNSTQHPKFTELAAVMRGR